MVKYYPSISDNLGEWAMKQWVFFTASAPLSGKHVNVSPKGLASTTFTIFSPNQCAYVDATGSGNETISHIYENGRVTIMFCSFENTPRILRLFCKGRVVEYDSPAFQPLIKKMDKDVVGARAVILLDVFLVQTSCGYGVPLLQKKAGKNGTEDEQKPSAAAAAAAKREEAEGDEEKGATRDWGFVDRATLGHWAGSKIERGELAEYQKQWNARSLDGLPGLKTAMRDNGDVIPWINLQVRAKRMLQQRDGFIGGMIAGVLVYLLLNLVLQQQQQQLHWQQRYTQPFAILKAPW